MSGPKNDGDDAFGDFFGDPTPSGRMRPSGGQDPKSADETQLMDVDRGDTPIAPMPPAEQPTRATESMAEVPAAWWESGPTESPTVVSDRTWDDVPPPTRAERAAPRRTLTPFAIAAMVVGAVLFGGLCVGGALWTVGDNDEPVVAETTVTTTSSPTSDTATSESPTSQSSTSSSSDDEDDKDKKKDDKDKDERTGTLPAGTSKCAGPSSGVSVASGSEVTSCAFSVAVRDAYVAKTGGEGKARLRVTSPVTNRAYTMRCSGDDVTRCTGGNNAVVVLY